VFTSTLEAQGNVTLGALSMGVHVVASRTGGIPQMVAENVGDLFEPGDEAELAHKIRYLYSNPDVLASMRTE
jgi:glycosyltransferase involved in cell wall biosynthesis